LAEGEVVAFAPGGDGAHQLINATEQPVRYLMASSGADADVVTYPDSGKIGARGGGFGVPGAVTYVLPTAAAVGYFDGEPDE